jgi:DNA-3-methyladenine glycosylase II
MLKIGWEYNDSMFLITPTTIKTALHYLAEHDPILEPLVVAHSPCTIKPHQDYYGALVLAIIGQQLSTKAATAIKQRFEALFDNQLPSPEQILTKSVEDLRAVGFSNAKSRYVRDLAEHVLDGRLKFDRIPEQSNDEIIAELTNIKGVGEWTAHMFLLFCVGRSNILPTGDLGIRNGIRKLYDFEDAISPDQVREVALTNNWHPYESIASWYIWRSLDNAPV